MASNISTTNIDETYPVAGQDNDSQGFRDNFSQIKTQLGTASTEITTITKETENNKDDEKDELRNMISTLISQNQNMLLENKDMREMVKDMIPKIGNNE